MQAKNATAENENGEDDSNAKEMSEEIKTYVTASEQVQYIIANEVYKISLQNTKQKNERFTRIYACFLVIQQKFQEVKKKLNTLAKTRKNDTENVYTKAIGSLGDLCYKQLSYKKAIDVINF